MTSVTSGDRTGMGVRPVCESATERTSELTGGKNEAEDALRANQERWRAVFETSMVGMTTSEVGGNYTSANAAFLRMVGYTEAEILAMRPADLTCEEDRPVARALMEEIQAGRRSSYQVEKRYRRKDGELIWVEVYGSRVAASDTRPAMCHAIVIDTSDRKRVDGLLRASEQRWRTLFETSSVAIVTVDVNRRVVTANAAFQNMVGYTAGELHGFAWRDLAHEDDRTLTDALSVELETARRQVYQKEKRYLRKNGEVVWASVNASYLPAPEASAACFLLMIVDITERKRAELERRRLASIVEQANDLMAIADLEGTPIYLNKAGLNMVGFDDWEQAKARRGLHYMFPEDRPFVNQVLWPTVMEKGFWSGEIRFRHFKTGEAIPMLYSAFRIDDPETGQPANVGNVCRDITNRKRAEEALRRSQAELARVVRVTTIGEFGASIAHEINQPLSAILASGNACRRWLRNKRDLRRAGESLDRIISDAERAAEVIKRIRALTRNKPPEYALLDINEVIEEVIAFTHNELQAKQVSLRTDLQTDVPAVVGDRVQLQQVLVNLIMNGVEAMTSIVDRVREVVITSRLESNDAVTVMVQDAGAGLDPNDAPRIFDAFFTTKSNGMGMGLSISRSIIEAHGGLLRAAPAEPHGTVLIFTVPAADRSES